MNRSRRPAPKPFVAGGVLDPTQAQPAAATPPAAPRNYSYQNTPKRVTQTPQQQQQAVKTPQQTVAPAKKPFPEPIPEVKPEPISVIPDEPIDESIEPIATMQDDEITNGSPSKTGKVLFKKIFAIRKKSSVRAKEKKIRQNRQLRKVILPKNALMALNEVKGIIISDFDISSNVGGGFTAVVTVNGNQYEGKGPSKVFAKNNACEKALRDYVLAKMRLNPRRVSRPSSVSGDVPMDTSESIPVGENGTVSDGAATQKPLQEEDDVPMINLTSFALFKLFSEWENEGFEIPEFHPSAAGQAATDADSSKEVKEPKKPTIRNELPTNWETMHPATLLCMMRPGLTYNDYGVVGEKPNAIQSLGVIVDEKEFIGKGRSKKIARRNASVSVCNTLFGTNFELEEPAVVAAPAAS